MDVIIRLGYVSNLAEILGNERDEFKFKEGAKLQDLLDEFVNKYDDRPDFSIKYCSFVRKGRVYNKEDAWKTELESGLIDVLYFSEGG